MAEGLLRQLAGPACEVFSAGTRPTAVNPLAGAVMRERGLDLSAHRSKHVNEFLGQAFDYVITVCDQAGEACPHGPGRAERVHWSLPDPAAATGSPEARLQAFRAVRDELAQRLRQWWAALDPPKPIQPIRRT
jgi:arsenate reductase